MRWHRKSHARNVKYKPDDERIVTKFLFSPTTVLRDFQQVRWLEKASILQRYNTNCKWDNMMWVDDKNRGDG